MDKRRTKNGAITFAIAITAMWYGFSSDFTLNTVIGIIGAMIFGSWITFVSLVATNSL